MPSFTWPQTSANNSPMIQIKDEKSIDINDKYRDKPQIVIAYEEVSKVDFLITRDHGEECEQGNHSMHATPAILAFNVHSATHSIRTPRWCRGQIV